MEKILAYKRSGPESELPLVLLHALPLDGSMWDKVRLLLNDIDVLTIDAPGFGCSRPGQEFSATGSISAYVEALKYTLTKLGIEKIALGGLSMGGVAAAAFTCSHYAQVRALALMDTNIAADTAAQRARRQEIIAQAAQGQGKIALSDWPETMLSPAATAEIRQDLRLRLAAIPEDGLKWAQEAMAGRASYETAVEKISGPIYLIRGSDDPTCARAALAAWGERSANAQLREVPAAGHFTALENPLALAKILREFYAAARAA